MKLDMHCHVKKGSIDSKVSLDEYITSLKEQGFDGMLITDHDTYKGYRHWKNEMKGKMHEDFVVLKGIEYDTCDAGHIICIMPSPWRHSGAGASLRGQIFKLCQYETVLQISRADQKI